MIGETVTFGQTWRDLLDKLKRDSSAPSVGQAALALHLLDPQVTQVASVDLYDYREDNPDVLPPCATDTV